MGIHFWVENRNLRGNFKSMVGYTQTSGIRSFAGFEIMSVSILKAAGEAGE